MKKLTILLLILTVLLGGAWFLLKYSPESFTRLSFFQSKPAVQATAASLTPAEYLAWRDSLDGIDLLVRTEQDPRILRSLQERQQYFWKKLQSARQTIQTDPLAGDDRNAGDDKSGGDDNTDPALARGDNAATSQADIQAATQSNIDAVAPPQAGSTVATVSPNTGLIPFLSKILTITAVVLVALILLLLWLLKRRKAQLTRHLEAIREDDRFQGSRGGMLDAEPLRAPVRMPKNTRISSPNTLPETAALDLSALAATLAVKPEMPQSSREGTPLRPTAKQRVTQALKGLSEALTALKSEGGATERQEGTRSDSDKARVRSQNIVRPTQSNTVLAQTRFEREQDEQNEIMKLARRGFTPSEIARRLRMPQDQVEMVVRMHRDGDR